MKKFAALGLTAILASCGGGGGGGSSSPVPVPVVTATPSCPTGYSGTPPNCTAPSTGSAAITTSTQSVQVSVPPVGGFGGTAIIPPANTAASMTLFASTTAPAGVPVLSIRHHMTTANTPYVYYILQANAAVTLSGTLELDLTAPAGLSTTQNYYLAALYVDGTWGTIGGPATASSGTLKLSAPIPQLQFSAGNAIAIALYSGSPVYYGNITVDPATVALMDLNAVQNVTLGDTNPHATTFTIDASTCNGIATVKQTSLTTFQFAAAALGTCSVTASDNLGHSTAIPVSVQTTSVVIQ